MRRSGAGGRTSRARDAPLRAARLPFDALARRPLKPTRRAFVHLGETCAAGLPALHLRSPQLP
jgi:hypothetical protein